MVKDEEDYHGLQTKNLKHFGLTFQDARKREPHLCIPDQHLKEHCHRDFSCCWFNSAKITAFYQLSFKKMLLQNQ